MKMNALCIAMSIRRLVTLLLSLSPREVFHEHYGVYGKVISDKPFVICGELCIRVDFGGMPEGGAYGCTCFVM